MNANAAATKVFQVRGTTSDFTTCELCGRSDLRSTVALTDETGAVVHFGSECAARATGWTVKETTLRVKAADEATRQQQAFESFKASEARAAYIASFGGFAAYQAAKRAGLAA